MISFIPCIFENFWFINILKFSLRKLKKNLCRFVNDNSLAINWVKSFSELGLEINVSKIDVPCLKKSARWNLLSLNIMFLFSSGVNFNSSIVNIILYLFPRNVLILSMIFVWKKFIVLETWKVFSFSFFFFSFYNALLLNTFVYVAMVVLFFSVFFYKFFYVLISFFFSFVLD